LLVLSSTKRVVSPLSSTAPMKSIESCPMGMLGTSGVPTRSARFSKLRQDLL
jgi:hypothetical protein